MRVSLRLRAAFRSLGGESRLGLERWQLRWCVAAVWAVAVGVARDGWLVGVT